MPEFVLFRIVIFAILMSFVVNIGLKKPLKQLSIAFVRSIELIQTLKPEN